MTLIEKLFEQALDQAVPETWTMLTPAQLSKLKDKFAELIVSECVMLCDKVYEQNDNVKIQAGATFCREDIKKHFGVEE